MSRNKRNYRTSSYGRNRSVNAARTNHSAYVYGNTAREIEITREMEEPRRQPRPQVRKNRERARHMSAGYVLFLAAALCTAALVLVNYIQLQAQLTNLTKSVASKESELNSMRIANDEEYNRILNSINLEEVKRIAIGELGMTYAEEGQIITYTNERNDYMRRATDESH